MDKISKLIEAALEERVGLNAGELEKVCGSVMTRAEVLIIDEGGRQHSASYAEAGEIGDQVIIYIVR